MPNLVIFEYKGYFTGSITYDFSSGSFHGRVADIRDVVTFEGKTHEEVEKAFRDSVDDYLEFCAKKGRVPEKPSTDKGEP